MTARAEYWRRFLTVEYGDDPLHELVHFWDNVGTSFGAFQLLGFHITAKAMGIALQALWRKGISELPIDSYSAEKLEGDEKVFVQRALQYKRLLSRYEVEDPRAINVEIERFDGGSREDAPSFLVSRGVGRRVGSSLLGELKNLVLGRVAGLSPAAGVEGRLYDRAVELLGPARERQLAYLCDWALMSPNPNLLPRKKPGEIHPGWRFFDGLSYLSKLPRAEVGGLDNYEDFAETVARGLGLTPPGQVLEMWDSFTDLAKRGEQNQTDAWRNREASREMHDLLQIAGDIRREKPEAFPLAYDHATLLRKKLPPLVEKRGHRFVYWKEDTSRWFPAYIGRVTLAMQAFERRPVRCAYSFFGTEKGCQALSRSKYGMDHCLTLPSRHEDRYIKCGFVQLVERMGYPGEPIAVLKED